jgi:hypothetical protein
VRISGSSEQHLSPSVREAKEKARDRLHKHAAAKPLLVPASEPTLSIVEPPCLAATRRTISKARPDDQGFAAASSKGVVPLKIAPASIELDISARSSKADFAKPDPEQEAERGSFYYSPPITLEFWSVDDAKGLATSCSPLEWTDALALPIEAAETG